MSEAIKVILKQKNISLLVDFCIEEKIEFGVRPQPFPDTDWEFNMMVKDIKTAVNTGMFLRENRIEIAGNEQQAAKAVKKPAPKKTKEEEDKPATTEPDQPKNPEEEKGLF